MKAYVVRGYGIECEEEMTRAARVSQAFEEVNDLVLPKFFAGLEESKKIQWPFEKGDWILLPGGFSYADHFGSGKLLALRLKELGFFEAAFAKGAHFVGVCNGFQMLVESGVFGDSVTLEFNKPRGFVNRWVQLSQMKVESSIESENALAIRLPVRHGEGCLKVGSSSKSSLAPNVKAFLFYDDAQFSNGSDQEIAGLLAHVGESKVWGMMPHPEISLQKHDDPDFFATDFMPQHRESQAHQEGDGLKLLRQIFSFERNPS